MLSDDFIRRLVHSQPIPARLIASLGDAPLVRYPRRYSRQLMTPVLWETLKLVAAGYSNRGIADAQGVPYETAKDRVKRVLARMDARDRIEVVTRCYREGIM